MSTFYREPVSSLAFWSASVLGLTLYSFQEPAEDFEIDSAIQCATEEQEQDLSFQDLFLSATSTFSPPLARRPAPRPSNAQLPIERTPVVPITLESLHQHRRMQQRYVIRKGTPKKVNLQHWRVKKGVERAITVNARFSGLRSSYTVRQEARVYTLGELKGLGVETVPWDGK